MRWAIWYHLHNLKNVKNTHGRVLLLVKLQAFSIPPWVFFTFFKLNKWYQIAQNDKLLLMSLNHIKSDVFAIHFVSQIFTCEILLLIKH